jgi:CBS domain containing-hemolysin-like protein
MKNPYGLTATANTTTTNRTVIQKSTAYSSNTFSAVIRANVNPTSTIFTVGDTVVGQVSGALGTVAFSNATTVSLTGDKYFSNNERIVSSSGLISANIIINTFGNIYTKDISPIYVQNITNVTRSNTQAESFKLIIKV